MILVTGATGNVGSHLLPLLVERGAQVRVLAHSAASRPKIESPGVEAVDGDFDRPDLLEQAMEGCARLFLLSPPHPDQQERETSAIDSARRAGVAHVVALSASGADRGSPSAFGRWHAAIDDHLMASGMGYTILRSSGFMQVHLLPVDTVKTSGCWYGMTGDGAHGFIDAQDVAAVAAEVITTAGHEGKIYELTGPGAITMPEAAAQLGALIGRGISYIDLPEEQFRANLVQAGLPEWLADAAAGLYRSIREGHLATITNHVEGLTGLPARPYATFAEAHRHAFAS